MRKIFSTLICLLALWLSAFSQTRTVTGKVTDKDGNPIPFATIQIKGTNVGVASDNNGFFDIKLKEGATLQISAAGYSKVDVAVGSRTSVTTILQRNNATNIDEVVVTAAAGVRRQAKSLGYSTATINSNELTNAKVTSIATGLAAKVSGLSINLTNNGVKADTRVVLRGNRSILGNNQALLVVDNIQLPITYLNQISPNDVENVSILKGASASALYGSAASNGVIIVTTKVGSSGKPTVKLSTSIAFEEIAYLPAFQNQFGTYGGEGAGAPGTFFMPGQPYIPYVPYENQNFGPRFNGQMVPIGAPIRVYRADGTYSIQQDSVRYSAVPNAKRNFFDRGITTTNNISYATGDTKSRFYLSAENVSIKGVLPKDVANRTTIRVNGSKETGIFKAEYHIGYTLNHSNTTTGAGVPYTWGTTGYSGGYGGSQATPFGQGTAGGSYFQNRSVYWTIINSPAFVDLRRYRNWQTNPFASPDGYFNAYYGNPWWQIDQSRLDEKSNDLLANIKFSVKVSPWLDLQYSAGIARDDYNNKYTQVGYNFAAWAIADTLGAGNIPSSVKVLSPGEGDAISYNQRLTSDLLASAHKTFGKFDVRFIAGTSLVNNTIRLMSTSANALVIPNFYNVSNGNGSPLAGEYKEETRVVGVFGDLTLGYNNYLFLHGSVRNDQTSLLSLANNSYTYPALDASIVLTEAIPSLRNNKVLSFAKVRGAISQTAQVSIGAYSLSNLFNSGAISGFSLSSAFANPNIKPEISDEKEIGIELGFFKNRIRLEGAYYNTSTSNQTIPISISATTGFTTAYVNSGVMSNKGYELDLKAIPIQSKSVTWSVGINYSYNKNILESLGYNLTNVAVTNNANSSGVGTGAATANVYAQINLPYPYLKGSDWNRDPQGRIIINPATGLPSANTTLANFGTTNAPTKIGFNTSVTYKNITLSAVVDGRFGAVVSNTDLGSSMDFTGVSAYSASFGRQPFVIPNSSYFDASKNTYVANTSYTMKDGNLGFWANTWQTVAANYITSADFIKLREISLSYNFPQKLIEAQKAFKAVSFGITGRNLFTAKAKSNVWSDPEFSNTTGNAQGVTNINQLPPTRFIGVNLSLTF